MNATQYEFDVDADTPVGTVLFTILISVEDPSTATYFNLHLRSKYRPSKFLRFSINQTAKLQTRLYFSTNIKNELDYDNDTMLYIMPVNIVLHKPFDPNDDVTTHLDKFEFDYEDNNLASREIADIILHIQGKPCIIDMRSFEHIILAAAANYCQVSVNHVIISTSISTCPMCRTVSANKLIL